MATKVLIAETFNNGVSLTGSTPLIQPPNWVDWKSWCEEVTWTISFLGITDGGTIGAPANTLPSAFLVKARFEYMQMHAGIFYRNQIRRWSNMSDEEVATHIVEQIPWFGPGQVEPPSDPITGVSDGVICSRGNTGSGIPDTAGYNPTTGLFANPIILRRTVRHFPRGMRVNMLNSTITGGTAPRLLLGVEADPR